MKHIRQGTNYCSQEYKSLSGQIFAFLVLFSMGREVPTAGQLRVICLKQSLRLQEHPRLIAPSVGQRSAPPDVRAKGLSVGDGW